MQKITILKILIKGDNLEVLKHLVNAYERDVKMIYIDPPYNTGNDGFVYEDDIKFTPDELSKLAGIDIEKAKRILDFVNSKSNSHSAWLTFMYPRLYIARRLLKDDGVIFVSIDDNEVAQLRLLMDEIFGEENFLYQLTIVNNLNGNDNSSGMMETHEYCLIYAKNKDNFEFGVLPIDDEKELEKWQIDKKGYYKEGGSLKATGVNAPREKRPNLFFPIYINKESLDFSLEKKDGYDYELLPITDGKEMSWYWSKEKFLRDKDEVIVKKTRDGFSLYKKQRPSLGDLPSKRGKTTFYSPKYSMANSNAYIKKLFNEKVFDYSKPIELIKDFVRLGNVGDEYVLDFFAGSGTTGDAVMQLNAEDGGDRKFILVQLPEPIDPKKSKTAYDFVKNELKIENPTIFDITKERLIRAAKKIKEENKDKEWIDKIDLGFKEFETIPMPEENLKDIEELEDVDLFREITDKNALLTTWKVFDGIKLHKDLKEIDFNGYKGYYLENKLYLVDGGFRLDNLAAILERIDKDSEFLPSKIVINGYVFDSKTQREIYESINNYNKKDLDKIELIVRY
jgi:adenine-specific DNA-methyltransferase